MEFRTQCCEQFNLFAMSRCVGGFGFLMNFSSFFISGLDNLHGLPTFLFAIERVCFSALFVFFSFDKYAFEMALPSFSRCFRMTENDQFNSKNVLIHEMSCWLEILDCILEIFDETINFEF